MAEAKKSAGGDTKVSAGLPHELVESLDEWRENERMSRSAAIRWILDQFFKKRAATGLQ
jgi:metal-responsive CopG/Arc/MetJ family transcriptional regulator